MYGSGVYVSLASQPLPWGRGWLTRLVYCIRDYAIFSKVVCVCNGSGAYALYASGGLNPMLAQVVCITYTPLPLHIHHDVVEAHCYFVNIGRTACEQIRSRINNNWCTQLTKAYMAETSCIVLIHSATYLLTISSPDIYTTLLIMAPISVYIIWIMVTWCIPHIAIYTRFVLHSCTVCTLQCSQTCWA